MSSAWRARTVLVSALLGMAAPACRCGGTVVLKVDGGGTTDAGPNPCNPDAGSLNCGGSCVDTMTDPSNCGACGVACGTALCCSGGCVQTASCAFAVTSATPAAGWQNGGDWITLHGAGFDAGMRVFIADGRAPVRVLDASHALIQTPPGPVGLQPLKVALGSQTAVLAKGFTYGSAGIDNVWAQKPLAKVRGEDPGVAVMQDGRVLVAGGTTVPDSLTDTLNTGEIYDPGTDGVTLAANTMSTHRWQNSAVTLLTGKVLVVGGACNSALGNCVGDPTPADLFDPATNTFQPTGHPLNVGRAYTRSILMVDGRVLIASANDPSVEVYDPALDTFTKIDHTPAHIFGFIARLRDGRVLLGAGDTGQTAAETFDADTNTFTPVGPLQHGRSMLSGHTLPDGRVFVIGGADVSAGGINTPLTSMEAFDPVANTFSTLPYALVTPRCWHASALVRDGTILVMGGYTLKGLCSSYIDTVELVNPVAGTVKPFPTLLNKNTEWNAVTLLNGSVLGVGGGACGTGAALPDLDFLPGAAQ